MAIKNEKKKQFVQPGEKINHMDVYLILRRQTNQTYSLHLFKRVHNQLKQMVNNGRGHGLRFKNVLPKQNFQFKQDVQRKAN